MWAFLGRFINIKKNIYKYKLKQRNVSIRKSNLIQFLLSTALSIYFLHKSWSISTNRILNLHHNIFLHKQQTLHKKRKSPINPWTRFVANNPYLSAKHSCLLTFNSTPTKKSTPMPGLREQKKMEDENFHFYSEHTKKSYRKSEQK